MLRISVDLQLHLHHLWDSEVPVVGPFVLSCSEVSLTAVCCCMRVCSAALPTALVILVPVLRGSLLVGQLGSRSPQH